MRRVTFEQLMKMAATGDPETLRQVGLLLGRPVPGSLDSEFTVVSACRGALVAFEAYTEFLQAHPLGRFERETCLPTMGSKESWGLLRRWMLGLQLWSPCFGGDRDKPPRLCTAEWLNRVLHGIFDLVYVLIERYSRTEIASLIRESFDFRRMAVQLTYGALTVETVSITPAVVVQVHPFWKEGAYAGMDTLCVLRDIVHQHPAVDFVLLILRRVVDITRSDSLLYEAAQLHALAYALLQLYDICGERVRACRAIRWLALCVRRVVDELAEYPLESVLALRALDTKVVGRLLSLCFQFVCEVAEMEGGGGWILEGLREGLLRGVINIGVFAALEECRSQHVLCLHYSSVLREDCDEVLASLVPHLLTPAVRGWWERR
ncbi:hypothetical protein VNI00_018413 [Paramarasmius palmivorus]|uniref:Uncharacterized protein n=1 Tax=Paramarasmius palmivorus TaxID=297713 RepID=A0AAW0AX57_9AGAR